MILRIDADMAYVQSRIQRVPVQCKRPVFFKSGLIFKDRLIGNINSDHFWLQKIKPRYWNATPRYFKGKIVEYGDGVVIKGKFRYSSVGRVFLAIPAVFLGLVFLVRRVDYLQALTPIERLLDFVPLLVILAIYFGIQYALTILVYRKEERYVIDFFKSLGRGRE